MKNFISVIKEYSTRNVLYTFGEISIQMAKLDLKGHPEGQMIGTALFPFQALIHGFIEQTVPVMLSAWDIPEIAYASITTANDYRRKKIKEQEIGRIVNLYRGYENQNSGSKYLKELNYPDLMKFITGMTSEQFRYQCIGWTLQNFNRNYHMLLGSHKINRDKILDINKVTQKVFGVSADELFAMEFILLWLCAQHSDPLNAAEEMYCKRHDGILTKENLWKIINYYSVSYDEVRKNSLCKQIFYTKPFVKTQKQDEYIMVSFYLLLMVLADGLYWLIRDFYYNNDMGLEFLNAFGGMFEDYFKELAELYLPVGSWYKIEEGKTKSADFFVELDNVVLLFELKSGLMQINGRQQVPDLKSIEEFYSRNIKKAYSQLLNSEKNYLGKKPILKVFLLYEYVNNGHLIMESIPEIFNKDDKCFLMTIQDLEMLFVAYKNDNLKFQAVLENILSGKGARLSHPNVLHMLAEQNLKADGHFVGERDYIKKVVKKMELEFNI